jgi:Tfp pilus assembly ATPase PilU
MATLMDYLTRAVQEEASDLFIVPGAPVSIKLDGQLRPIGEEKVKAPEGSD